jgi:NIMA (never in mitosis gene a)-related kinase
MRYYKTKNILFKEDEIWKLGYQILKGLHYLHSNKIIHRDIKLLNIFLMKNGRIKIGDMGISKHIQDDEVLNMTRVGTPLYLSPEIVKGHPYDYKIDIWALGCTLYHLMLFKPPFEDQNIVNLGKMILCSTPNALPEAYGEKLTQFVMLLLEKDPSKRPTAAEALEYIPFHIKVSGVF